MDKERTGNIIREARKRQGITQAELGEKLGVTNKAVSRWEKGEAFPDVTLLDKLSLELGISIEEIVQGNFNPNSINDPLRDIVVEARNQKIHDRRVISKKICISLQILIILISILQIVLWREVHTADIPTFVFYIDYVTISILFIAEQKLTIEIANPGIKISSKWKKAVAAISILLIAVPFALIVYFLAFCTMQTIQLTGLETTCWKAIEAILFTFLLLNEIFSIAICCVISLQRCYIPFFLAQGSSLFELVVFGIIVNSSFFSKEIIVKILCHTIAIIILIVMMSVVVKQINNKDG